MVLSRDLGDRHKQAWILGELGVVQRLTGDHRSATVMHREALESFRDVGDRRGEAYTLNQLGLAQQLTGDYPAAAASHQQALQLCRDLGQLYEQAEVLNSLGKLSSRTAASQQARDHHNQALAIARDLGAPPEEARALEGIGNSHLRDGSPSEAAAPLRQALAIYQRIGTPRRPAHPGDSAPARALASHLNPPTRKLSTAARDRYPAKGRSWVRDRRHDERSGTEQYRYRQHPAGRTRPPGIRRCLDTRPGKSLRSSRYAHPNR
jgi:tetratricopeptide (TPR) repeat protein